MFNYTEEINNLKLLVDFDSKNEFLNEVKFSGPLYSKYIANIVLLENLLKNVPMKNISPLIAKDPILNLKFPSVPLLLFIKWFKNVGGIVTLTKGHDFICNCSGLTRTELHKLLNVEVPVDYGEVVAKTKASIACGACTNVLKAEYRKSFRNIFKGKINTSFFNELGDWISHKNLTPAELILGVDDLIAEWCQINHLSKLSFEIVKTEGLHFTIKVDRSVENPVKLIDELEHFLFIRSGLLIILIN